MYRGRSVRQGQHELVAAVVNRGYDYGHATVQL
jgi:hypothetical protein